MKTSAFVRPKLPFAENTKARVLRRASCATDGRNDRGAWLAGDGFTALLRQPLLTPYTLEALPNVG
jgi:hypothetical protein